MYSFVVFCLNQQIGFLQLICILQRISMILLDMKSKNPVKKSTSRVFLRKEDNYNDTKASRGSINSNDDVIRKHIPCKKIRVLVFFTNKQQWPQWIRCISNQQQIDSAGHCLGWVKYETQDLRFQLLDLDLFLWKRKRMMWDWE